MKKTVEAAPKAKIIPLRNQPSIFSPALRERLEASVSPYTDRPTETVSSAENAVCVFLVSAVARFAAKLGEQAGKKFVDRVLPKASV